MKSNIMHSLWKYTYVIQYINMSGKSTMISIQWNGKRRDKGRVSAKMVKINLKKIKSTKKCQNLNIS